jgi:hypothetical protein
VVENPVTHLSGKDSFLLAAVDAKNLIEGRFTPGSVDSVVGYVKLNDDRAQRVPARYWGFSSVGDAGLGSSGWTSIMCNSNPSTEAAIEMYAWLHHVHWSFLHRLHYADEIMPNPGSGRNEGESGGDLDYRRPPGEHEWLGFYRHIMSDHVTSKMWSEARYRPWGDLDYARDWLVLGPYKYQGEPGAWLDEVVWDPSRSPVEGEKGNEFIWKRWRSAEDFIDLRAACGASGHTVACAFARIRSDQERDAVLWLGYDDSIAAFVNGKEVHLYAGPHDANPDDAAVPIRLRKGENTVLLKVADIAGGWGFYARVGDQRGRTLKGVNWVR